MCCANTHGRPALSFLDDITVLILTYNEEPNIERTVAALARFRSIVVVDSGSGDKTVEIAKRFENTTVFVRSFDNHAAQWNFGLRECGIKTPWVLALDADYMVPRGLVDEIAALAPGRYTGFRAAFEYRVFGRPLSSTLYPPVTVLFRAQDATYIQGGHTQRLQTSGPVGTLAARIVHDDRKSLTRWFSSQQKYAKLEAEFILGQSVQDLRFSDRLRRMGWPAPIFVFAYTLFVKRCLFDGWAGWYYVLQRTIAEMMIAAEIVDRRVRRDVPNAERDSSLEEVRQ